MPHDAIVESSPVRSLEGIEPSCILEVLDKPVRRRLCVQWREVFAPHVLLATGKSVYKGCDWHAFSYREALVGRSRPPWQILLEGRDALAEYGRQRAEELYVVPASSAVQAVRIRGDVPPDLLEDREDVWVAPPDFAWTAFFTHHGWDHGPWFARPLPTLPGA